MNLTADCFLGMLFLAGSSLLLAAGGCIADKLSRKRKLVPGCLENCKMIVAVVLFLIVTTLSGCGHRLTEGEVYDKKFIAAHTQALLLPMTIYNGKTSTTVLVPYTYYYPDTWTISIKDFQDGKWIYAEYCVPEEVYTSAEIGSIFRYEKDRDLTEPPYTRERGKSK